jgi:hypothetical protein
VEKADFTTAAFSVIVKKIAADGAEKITTKIIKKLLAAKDVTAAVNSLTFILSEEFKKEVAVGVTFKNLLTDVRSREVWKMDNGQVISQMLSAIENEIRYRRGLINSGALTALSMGENPKGKNTVQWPAVDAEKKVKKIVEAGLVNLGNNAYHDRLYNAGRK